MMPCPLFLRNKRRVVAVLDDVDDNDDGDDVVAAVLDDTHGDAGGSGLTSILSMRRNR
jgi:hypothetical protein